jgi:hypothetical protein
MSPETMGALVAREHVPAARDRAERYVEHGLRRAPVFADKITRDAWYARLSGVDFVEALAHVRVLEYAARVRRGHALVILACTPNENARARIEAAEHVAACRREHRLYRAMIAELVEHATKARDYYGDLAIKLGAAIVSGRAATACDMWAKKRRDKRT